jgi:LysM repeat protein
MRAFLLVLVLFAAVPVSSEASVEHRLDELEMRVSEMQLILERLSRQTPPQRPPAPPASGRSYQVRSGDSYWSIARRHGLRVSDLERANPGIDPRRLRIGAKVRIPGPSLGMSEGRSVSGSYQIRKGDILGRIAQRNGISLKELIAANPKVDPRRLRIGSTLTIPGRTSPSPSASSSIPQVETKSGLPDKSPPAPRPIEESEEPHPNPYLKALKSTPPIVETAEPVPSFSKPELITLDEDTRFSEIANEHETTVSMLNELNKRDLSPEQMIKAGSQLYIPSR